MKVGFVIGHHDRGKGAYSEELGMYEFDYWMQVSSYFDDDDVWVHDSQIRSYTARQIDMAAKMAGKDYDLVIELHYNSYYKPTAAGCQAMHYLGNEKTRVACQIFCTMITGVTGTRYRGSKPLGSGSRGYEFVRRQKADAMIIEPFFGNNRGDVVAMGSVEDMACMIIDFINCDELGYLFA